MTCPTCRGLMVKQHTHDLVCREGRLYMGDWRWVWRCLRCEQVSEIDSGGPKADVLACPDSTSPEALRLAVRPTVLCADGMSAGAPFMLAAE